MPRGLATLIWLLCGLLWPSGALAQVCAPHESACPPPEAAAETPSPTQGRSRSLLFFWGSGCPHCEDAAPFVEQLARENPGLPIERIEVRQDASGRNRFLTEIERLQIPAPGIPTFVYGDDFEVGFDGAASERRLRALIQGSAAPPAVHGVELPWVGTVDPNAVPLPAFTLLIGLIDGINPCAMWVLIVLMGILSHVKERARMFLFGGIFVLMSGLVYFAFMTVWVSLFRLVGLSRYITIGLGVVVLGMGLINLKELVWFKRGVSLVIPQQAKPTLFRRMRAITRAASLPAATLAIAVLAFFVNLIELGCTLGLPAVFTRILSTREGLSPAGRYGYIGLYNLAYVVPLGLIVLGFAWSSKKVALSERSAKILKGISGALLVTFGLLFILAPELLS